MAAHLMAAALRDREIIHRMIHSIGGWKWYLDEYIADGTFYMEEFGKQYSMIGEMLLWCRAMQNLGLDEWGFGYTGTGGATMRRYMEGLIKIGLPRIRQADGSYYYPHIHMGDAGPSSLVPPGGTRRPRGRYWMTANMNGRDYTQATVPKMTQPFWYEASHKQWPEAGFDYLLAQFREPGTDTFYPTLLYGLKPIPAAQTTPPAVESFAARERGFAMLRMEESPAYWTSPRPVVALQFGMYYVHYVHDCFTLLDYRYHAKPLYGKRQLGSHRGYRGGHPWRDSAHGHQGLVVDGLQIKPVDDGNAGCANQAIREGFHAHVKFVAVHAPVRDVNGSKKGLYPGVDMERALFLTDQYLLDVFHCVSETSRNYRWIAHPHGAPEPDDAGKWAASDDLKGGKLWAFGGGRSGAYDLPNVRKLVPGDARTWMFGTRQGNGIGVRLRMLPEAGTTLYHDTSGKETTIIADRNTGATAFVALHEHYRDNEQAVASFDRVAQTDHGVLVSVRGADSAAVNDLVMLRYNSAPQTAVTLAGKQGTFTFDNYAHLRMGADAVEIAGDLSAMELETGGKALPVKVNGKPVKTTVKGSVLILRP
jgi:hypothetical protein